VSAAWRRVCDSGHEHSPPSAGQPAHTARHGSGVTWKRRSTTPALSASSCASSSSVCSLEKLANSVKRAETIGSPAYPWPDGALAARARAEADRAFNPPGVARQMAAVRSSGDRRAKLAAITAPTMVLHGADDPLVPVAAGRDTAANIKGAELRIIPGMGHDLPPALYATFVEAIERAVSRARQGAASPA